MRDKTLQPDALIEDFLLGNASRETALRELGSERLSEIEFQRDTLRRDFEWGLAVAKPADSKPR